MLNFAEKSQLHLLFGDLALSPAWSLTSYLLKAIQVFPLSGISVLVGNGPIVPVSPSQFQSQQGQGTAALPPNTSQCAGPSSSGKGRASQCFQGTNSPRRRCGGDYCLECWKTSRGNWSPFVAFCCPLEYRTWPCIGWGLGCKSTRKSRRKFRAPELSMPIPFALQTVPVQVCVCAPLPLPRDW